MPLPRPSRSWRRAFPSSGAVAPRRKSAIAWAASRVALRRAFRARARFLMESCRSRMRSAVTCPSLLGKTWRRPPSNGSTTRICPFADEHVEGIDNPGEVKDIRRRAIQAGLKLVDCPIRHLGTEKGARNLRPHRRPSARCRREAAVRNGMHRRAYRRRRRDRFGRMQKAFACARVRARSFRFSPRKPWWRRAAAAPIGSSALQRARHRACAWPG